MLLEKEVECILQVLVAVDEYLVVLIEVVDKLFHEEQVIGVKRRKLDRCEVSSKGLRVLISCCSFLRSRSLLDDHLFFD